VNKMGYEVISNGSSGYSTKGLMDLICFEGIGCPDFGCPEVNIGCDSECPGVDPFCTNPGLGCRHGCGGATGDSCVEPTGGF
jgi:hypothetical protein